MKKLAVLFLLLAVFGCAPSSQWVKPGSNETDFNRDKYTCLREAQQTYTVASVDVVSGSAEQGSRTNIELFQTCMLAKGWRQEAANRNSESSANSASRQNRKQLEIDFKNLSDELSRVCLKPDFEILRRKSPCSVGDFTQAQLSDKENVSDAERVLLLKQMEESQKIRSQMAMTVRSGGSNYDRKLADILENAARDYGYDILALSERKITWGSFNNLRKQRNAALQAAVKAARN